MRNCACICSDGSICIDLQRVQGALTVMLAACWLRGLFYHFLGRSFWTTPTNNSEQFLNVLEPAWFHFLSTDNEVGIVRKLVLQTFFTLEWIWFVQGSQKVRKIVAVFLWQTTCMWENEHTVCIFLNFRGFGCRCARTPLRRPALMQQTMHVQELACVTWAMDLFKIPYILQGATLRISLQFLTFCKRCSLGFHWSSLQCAKGTPGFHRNSRHFAKGTP